MKVLAIIDAIELSGPGKGLLQLVDACATRQVEIVVANFTYEKRRSFFNEEAATRGIRCVLLRTRGRFEKRTLRQLQALVVNEGIDIIQSHSFKPHLYAILLRRRLRRPWLAFAHGWTLETWRVCLNNAIERRLLRYADHVIALSESLEKDLRAHGRSGPVSIVMNAITRLPEPTTTQLRDAARCQLTVAAGAFVIACIGRLSFEKAQDLLLTALQRVRPATQRPIVVLLAGDGPFRERLQTQAAALRGHVDVRFLGHVADVAPLYVACDMVAMPSRSEGTPNVILEAMSYGLPIVATRVGSVPSMVTDATEALLVDTQDVVALASKLQRVYDDSSVATKMGRNARAALWPRFSIETRVGRIVDVYGQLLAASAEPCASH